MKYIICLLFLLQFKNCKSETPSDKSIVSSEVLPINKKKENVDNYFINSIEKSAIGKKIDNKNILESLKKSFSNSLEREIERPYIWDIFTASNDSLLQFYDYKEFTINKFVFKSYYIKINYEDASYQAILLINQSAERIDNSMIVYEELLSEEKYLRTTEVKNDKIEIQLKRNEISKNLNFILNNGLFLDYFDSKNVNEKWGNKEVSNSNSVYEYELKGETNNHLKNGYWIEKRYLIEYGKSIITDGNYKNGIKDGEWNYSPNGPVDKIEIYRDGKIIKISFP